MNRQQAISWLELGRQLAREVKAERKGNRAYVFVKPIHDALVCCYERENPFTEPRLVRIGNGHFIKSYSVECLELRPGFEEFPDDWDRYRYSSSMKECASLEALEAFLLECWHLSLDDLQLPHAVEHPF